MKGGGRLSFEHFTPLTNRQVVANGNRVLSSSPIHNLKSVHTQPHGSLQHPILAIFWQKSHLHHPQVLRHVCIQGKASPGKEQDIARGMQFFQMHSHSKLIKRWQRRGIHVKTVTACWPRGQQ